MDEDRSAVLGHPIVARALRWGIVVWALIGVLFLAERVFIYLLFPISIIFAPLVVAVIVVYLLNPLVSGLERRGIRRIWGSLIVYLVFASLVGTALYFLIPEITAQVSSFIQAAPRILGRASGVFRDLAERFGIDLGGEGPGVRTETISDFFGRLVSITRGIFDLVLVFVLGPILAFYFLVDLPKIKRSLRAAVPARRRPEFESVVGQIGRAVGGFFRGQLLVALFVGVASSLVLWAVGLPFWIVVGLATGLFNLIPLIGPFIGGGIAVMVAFAADGPTGGILHLQPGWRLAVGSAVALLIVQQIDNHIMSPNIVGRTVRLHPVTVMLGLLVGGTLMGLLGMILAIPVIAAVKILILHYWDTRMTWPPRGGEAEFIRPPGPPPEPGQPVPGEPVPGEPAAREPVAGEPVPPDGMEESARPRGAAPAWLHAVRGLFAGRRTPREGGEAPPAPVEPARDRGSPAS